MYPLITTLGVTWGHECLEAVLYPPQEVSSLWVVLSRVPPTQRDTSYPPVKHSLPLVYSLVLKSFASVFV